MICPTCGSHLNDDLNFCTQCGTPLANTTDDAAYAPVDDNPTELFTETPAYTPAPQAEVYQPDAAPTYDAPAYEAAPAYDAPAYDAAPVYDAPAQYGNYDSFDSAAAEPVEKKKSGTLGLVFGIISLVLGVLCPMCCCCGLIGAIIGIVVSLIAVVARIVGLIVSKDGSKVGKILSIIGLILGAIVLICSIGYFIFLLIGVGGAMSMGLLEEFSYMY